ncbi:MAG: hypothetical protein GF341_01925 [candidate division Zixibacteria bacterium]|nr:hypothetical protein [candidate division Zixibacteria bacterium]
MISTSNAIKPVCVHNPKTRRAPLPGGFSFVAAPGQDDYRIVIGGCSHESGEVKLTAPSVSTSQDTSGIDLLA